MPPAPAEPLSELALVRAAKAGERGAYTELIRRHSGRLLRLARRNLRETSEAEDVVQEALARGWLKIASFDETRPLEPWLVRITLNLCRDRQRYDRVRSFMSLGVAEDASAQEPVELSDPSGDLVRRDLLRRLQTAIARLPPKLREPFVLVAFDERSQAEAGDILGISEKAVETRIYRARKLLRANVDGAEG